MQRTTRDLTQTYDDICEIYSDNRNVSVAIQALQVLIKEINQIPGNDATKNIIAMNCKCFLFNLQVFPVFQSQGVVTVFREKKDQVAMMLDLIKLYNKNPQLFAFDEIDKDRLQEAFHLLFEIYLTSYNSKLLLSKQDDEFVLVYDALLSFKKHINDFDLSLMTELKLIKHFLFNKTNYDNQKLLKNGIFFPNQSNALSIVTNLTNEIDKNHPSYEYLKYLRELLKLFHSIENDLKRTLTTKPNEVSKYKSKKRHATKQSKLANEISLTLEFTPEVIGSLCSVVANSEELISLEKILYLFVDNQDQVDEVTSNLKSILFSFCIDMSTLFFKLPIAKVLPLFKEKMQQLSDNANRLHDFLSDYKQYNFWSSQEGRNIITFTLIYYKMLSVKCLCIDKKVNKQNLPTYQTTDTNVLISAKKDFDLTSQISEILKKIEVDKQQAFEKYFNEVEDEENKKAAYRKFMREKAQRERRLKTQSAAAAVASQSSSAIEDIDEDSGLSTDLPGISTNFFAKKTYEEKVRVVQDEINLCIDKIQKIKMSNITILDYLKYIECIVKNYEYLVAITKTELEFSLRRNDQEKILHYKNEYTIFDKQRNIYKAKLIAEMLYVKSCYDVAGEIGDADLRNELFIYLQIYSPELLWQNNRHYEEDDLQIDDDLNAVRSNQLQFNQESPVVIEPKPLQRQKLTKPLSLPDNISKLVSILGKGSSIVGGAVRDSLRDILPSDYDLAIKNMDLEEAKRKIESEISGVSCKIINYGFPILSVIFPGEITPVQITQYIKPQERDITVNAFEYVPHTNELVYDNQSKNDFDKKRIAMFDDINQAEHLKSDIKRIFRVLYYAAKLNFSIDGKLDAALKNVAETCVIDKDNKTIVGLMLRKLFFNGFASGTIQLMSKRPYLIPIIFAIPGFNQAHELMMQRLCREMDSQYQKHKGSSAAGNIGHAPPSPSLFFATLLLPQFIQKLRVQLSLQTNLSEAINSVIDNIFIFVENGNLVTKQRNLETMKRKISNIWHLFLYHHFSKTSLRNQITLPEMFYEDFVKGFELWNMTKMFNYPVDLSVNAKHGLFHHTPNKTPPLFVLHAPLSNPGMY